MTSYIASNSHLIGNDDNEDNDDIISIGIDSHDNENNNASKTKEDAKQTTKEDVKLPAKKKKTKDATTSYCQSFSK